MATDVNLTDVSSSNIMTKYVDWLSNRQVCIGIQNKSGLIFKACLVILGILTIMCTWYSILLTIVFCGFFSPILPMMMMMMVVIITAVNMVHKCHYSEAGLPLMLHYKNTFFFLCFPFNFYSMNVVFWVFFAYLLSLCLSFFYSIYSSVDYSMPLFSVVCFCFMACSCIDLYLFFSVLVCCLYLLLCMFFFYPIKFVCFCHAFPFSILIFYLCYCLFVCSLVLSNCVKLSFLLCKKYLFKEFLKKRSREYLQDFMKTKIMRQKKWITTLNYRRKTIMISNQHAMF